MAVMMKICHHLTVNIWTSDNLITEKANKIFQYFTVNIASLSKHKDELESVLSMLNYKFDIIGISETTNTIWYITYI